MSLHSIKLPDIGEGVAEAEIVEWCVEVGDIVQEDDVLAAVMTDKATVEIPAPMDGRIAWLGAAVGDVVAVGTDIIRMEAGQLAAMQQAAAEVSEASNAQPQALTTPQEAATPSLPQPAQEPQQNSPKVLASPAVRARAKKANVDLKDVVGTAVGGRIRQSDLTRHLETIKASVGQPALSSPVAPYTPLSSPSTTVPMRGLRRTIAKKLAYAASHIPHITYVDAVDMTALEALRRELNESRKEGAPKLTLLPFLIGALVKAIGDSPNMNAHFDEAGDQLHVYDPVHIGIATQTGDGLMVPVLKEAQDLGLWAAADAVAHLAEGARDATLKRDALTGSTITITSLGAMGGLVTTPIINHPEVAILGINKMEVRPHWDGEQFTPRTFMNLSASFDHRVVDGWDAATFIQRIKALLETPAMIFIR